MKHGDKEKAKAVKSSQASAAKKASSQGGKSGGKEAVQAGGKTGKGKKQQAGAEKSSPVPKKVAASPKEEAAAAKGKGGKQAGAGQAGAGQAGEVPGAFTNPVISNAFKHTVKKYPNALRKLTD